MDQARFRHPALLIDAKLSPRGTRFDEIAPMHVRDPQNATKPPLPVPVAATLYTIAIVFVLSMPCFLTQATAQEDGSVVAIIAGQVRSQGFTCDKPLSAERVETAASAGQKAYLLKCEGVTYRVYLVPDQAAKIVKVE